MLAPHPARKRPVPAPSPPTVEYTKTARCGGVSRAVFAYSMVGLGMVGLAMVGLSAKSLTVVAGERPRVLAWRHGSGEAR